MKKKIIIIDDEALISNLIKEILEEDTDMEIYKIASDKTEFLKYVDQYSFDAALIDISFGGREGGLQLLQTLQDKGIQIPCIVLSAHDEMDYALKCLKAGAKGYVNKNYICNDLIHALREAIRGQMFVSGDRGQLILEEFLQKHS